MQELVALVGRRVKRIIAAQQNWLKARLVSELEAQFWTRLGLG